MTRVDISEQVKEICARIGVDPHYVARMEIGPTSVDVTLYRGVDGRCKGRKMVDKTEPENAAILYELVRVEVVT